MVIFSLENKFLRRWLWQKRLEIWLWCLEMISIQIMMGMIQLLSILMVNTLILLLQEYCYLPAAGGCSSGQHQQDWYYSDKLLICRTEAGPSRRLLPAHLVCNLPILVSKEAGWGGGEAEIIRNYHQQPLFTRGTSTSDGSGICSIRAGCPPLVLVGGRCGGSLLLLVLGGGGGGGV